MAETTGIGWTDATWNPWHGCLKVSEGCKFCYMYREKAQYGQDPMVVVRSKTKFRDPLTKKFNERGPLRIFTCSWSDFFIAEADEWRDDAWDVIRATPQHTYQILTKRPERILGHLPLDWPLPNVWLGVSVENQARADERIPQLLQVAAAVRFLSVEPLLGEVSLDRWFGLKPGNTWQECVCDRIAAADVPCITCQGRLELGAKSGLDWVIIGGESGHGARQMRLQWARDVLNVCVAGGVAVFMKQMGSVWAAENRATSSKGDNPAEWPGWARLQDFPQARSVALA